MNLGSPLFPCPIYIGPGLSHGILVPPQQISALLAPHLHRPPVSAPRPKHSSQPTSESSTHETCISLELLVYLFSDEGEQSIKLQPQTLLDVKPPPSGDQPHLAFSLSVSYTGHLQLHTNDRTISALSTSMTRNTTHKIGIIATSSGVAMVLLNGTPAIHVIDNLRIAPVDSTDDQVETRNVRTNESSSRWPFGALHLGNMGESHTSFDKNSTSSQKNMCCGALSGLQLLLHPKSELEALLRLFSSSSTQSWTPSAYSASHLTMTSNSPQLEQLASLGTMEQLVQKTIENATLFPPNSSPLPSRISRPLFSIAELDQWEQYLCAFTNPILQSLRPCGVKQREPHSGPLVLLCHDYRGGYFKDCAWEHSYTVCEESDSSTSSDSCQSGGRFATSLTKFVPDVYTFRYWRYIDIFVYFSHERVTIPPVATIQAAHVNGVKVLGTLICEWDAGYLETQRLIRGKGEDDPYFYAEQLIEIAVSVGFEGWLLNFEHPMKGEVSALAQWVGEFRRMANERGLIVVWYDSIIENGELKWQSSLNASNRLFFDSCDYFFTDYHWQLQHLEKTLEVAGTEASSVFVGIDVHGRGTYGGGGWNTTAGLKAISRAGYTTTEVKTTMVVEHASDRSPLHTRNLEYGSSAWRELEKKDDTSIQERKENLSVALFAPAWTLERNADSFDSFERNEALYWEGKEVWNLLSKKFEPQLSVYYRRYLDGEQKFDAVDFSLDDILAPFDCYVDGTDCEAEKDARKLSQDLSNDARGRFPGLTEDVVFPPRVAGAYWSWRHIKMSIVDSLVPLEWIDRQPELLLSVWFKGTGPNFGDFFRLRVLLLDSRGECMGEYDSGELKAQEEWQQLHYRWKDYGAGVRSILWLDGSKDAEHWAGHYGCVIDRPSIYVSNPHRVDAISAHIQARRLENEKMPFVSSFDLGQGSSLYCDGSPLELYIPPQQKFWYNLAAQSPIPSLGVYYENVTHFALYNPDTMKVSPKRSSSPHAATTTSEANKRMGTQVDKETGVLGEASSRPLPSMQRVSLSKSATRLFKIVDAKIVDASQVDGGVWNGSSCLKICATFSAALDTSASSAPVRSTSSTSIGKRDSPRSEEAKSTTESTGDSVVGSSSSVPSIRRGRSNRQISLLDLAKCFMFTEMATISLYPLSISGGERDVSLRLVFRTTQVNSNALALVLVTRRRKETGEVLEPYSWDLMALENRDVSSVESSLGWNHFCASWSCEEGILYDNVKIAIVAFSHQQTSSASPRSPRTSPRLVLASVPPSRPQRSNSISSEMLQPCLTLMVGFIKIEEKAEEGSSPCSSSSSPSLSGSTIIHDPDSPDPETPLELDYTLTWSPQTLFTHAPVYHVTLHWVAPRVPPHLEHLGPPHFIVTATRISEYDGAKVLCQGRTWNPSFEISSVSSDSDLLLTVSTVFPDFTHPPHLLQQIQVGWPPNN